MAEFAPAARQAVEPPPTTASNSPAGGAGQARGHATTTTQPTATATSTPDTGADTAPTTRVGRARACYGNPPRQLPDPRSPACLATIYEGDNSGPTTEGVTATDIRVAWPAPSACRTQPACMGAMAAVFDYVSRGFELYGRRLVFVPVESESAGSTPSSHRAYAQTMASTDVFAALELDYGSWHTSWFQELARQRVMTIATNAWSYLSDRDMFDALHPYVWSIYPSVEQLWHNLSDFACRSLAGRPAAHAGGNLKTTTRKFGLIASGNARGPWLRPLVDGLAACDAAPAVVEYFSQRDTSATLTAAIARLRDAGVTSLICACADQSWWGITGPVATAGWSPEWLLLGHSAGFDEFFQQSSMTAEQRSHLFGLQPMAKVVAEQSQWWRRALIEMGITALDSGTRRFVEPAYEQLLVLAAGIQAAGPNLTPDSFGRGLMATSFPNSEASRPPEFQPAVGFGPGDHSFVDDYALTWWDETATPYGPFTEPHLGSWCYLDQGARYQAGEFPVDADSRFFDRNAPCR